MSLLFKTAIHPRHHASGRGLAALSLASLVALVLGAGACAAPAADDADADPAAQIAEADRVDRGPLPPPGVMPLPVGGPVAIPPLFAEPGSHWTGPGRPPPWWGHDGWEGPPGHRHPVDPGFPHHGGGDDRPDHHH